jgi:hypothetical protein
MVSALSGESTDHSTWQLATSTPVAREPAFAPSITIAGSAALAGAITRDG